MPNTTPPTHPFSPGISRSLSALTGLVVLVLSFCGQADGPLDRETCILGIALGTILVYPPDVNRYLTHVEEPFNETLFPRRLLLAHALETRLEFRPWPFLDITPWVAALYSSRSFRMVNDGFFTINITVPVRMRLADASTGLSVQVGRYLAAEKLRLRGGISISGHVTQFYVVEKSVHELSARGVQLSLTGGCQVRLFERVFFDIEADVPVNSLPLHLKSGFSFNQETYTNTAPLPDNVYLWQLRIRPEIRANLKKKRLPDVL